MANVAVQWCASLRGEWAHSFILDTTHTSLFVTKGNAFRARYGHRYFSASDGVDKFFLPFRQLVLVEIWAVYTVFEYVVTNLVYPS
jgi:hypothetical protein